MTNNAKLIFQTLTLAPVAIAAAGFSTLARAQAAGGGEPLQEVVVTGSLLKRSVSEGSQLITAVDAENLRATGAGNAVEALASVAQNQPILNSATTYGAGTGFGSYANLRALGSSNTLVLFNGKRLVNNPFQMVGVDLNTIPLNMIERVETLSDGASSVYGSDAIAGVINFITRRELTGLSVEATRFQPEQQGGERSGASIAGGYGSLKEQGWNVYAGYTWHKKDRLRATDRAFAESFYIPELGVSRLQGTGSPANWSQTNPGQPGVATTNPSAPSCNPPSTIYADGISGVNACSFDSSPQIDAFPEQTDQSLLMHGSVRLGEQIASVEYLRAKTDIVSAIGSFVVRSNLTAVNPYYPGNGITPGAPGLNPARPVALAWRVVDLGPQVVNPVTNTDRVLAQLEGDVGKWDYEVSAMRSTSDVDLRMESGWVNSPRFRDSLTGANGAPFINPFGEQTPEVLQFLDSIALTGTAQRAEGTLNSYAVQTSRDLFALPAGAVQLALAVEYKEESVEFRTTPDGVASELATLLTNADADRDVYSGTFETRVPLVDTLDLDVSVRYDHYSDFGSTTNPKVMLSWQPLQSLTLRGSFNKGFRAPTLYNVFSPIVLLDTRFRGKDPILCPNGTANTALGGVQSRDCGVNPYRIKTGGNPDLDPERSRAYTLGVQWQASDFPSIGFDYWRYHLLDSIAPLAESAIFGDVAQFGSNIVRCSTVEPELLSGIPNCAPGQTGDPIAYVNQLNQNLGEVKTSGVDATLRWRSPAMRWGNFDINYRGTYVFDYEFQRTPNGPFFDRAGAYLDGFPVFDYSHYVTLGWNFEPVTVQLANRYSAGYTDCNLACPTQAPLQVQVRDVASYSLWDLATTYHATEKATITGRVTNLFDRDPPRTNKTSGIGTGWDERLTDPLGRAFSLTVKYDF